MSQVHERGVQARARKPSCSNCFDQEQRLSCSYNQDNRRRHLMKFMLFVLPTVPANLEERKRLRPIGRNNERY